MNEFNSELVVLNAIKSPIDNRDWIITDVLSELQDTLDYRYMLQPIRNQGSQGTCYAQSAACAKEWQEKINYNFNNYFSPQFFYNYRPNIYDDNDNNNDGMFGRDVMKLLLDIGICTEKEYPYGLIEDKNIINSSVIKNALNHKIKSYARVTSIDSLKLSLFKNGPCLISFPIYNYSMEMWKSTIKDTEIIGGHAMTVVGYTNDSFIIRNSWGSSWGDNGYCYYKLNDWGVHWEIWSIVDDKSIIIKPIDDKETKKNNNNSCFKMLFIISSYFVYKIYNLFQRKK